MSNFFWITLILASILVTVINMEIAMTDTIFLAFWRDTYWYSFPFYENHNTQSEIDLPQSSCPFWL